jgi:hypothetical protein
MLPLVAIYPPSAHRLHWPAFQGIEANVGDRVPWATASGRRVQVAGLASTETYGRQVGAVSTETTVSATCMQFM